jgi:hypothetical protein
MLSARSTPTYVAKIGSRRPGPATEPSKGRGAPGDQVAPSQSLDALDHPTHDRPRSGRRAPPGLRLATPRRVH